MVSHDIVFSAPGQVALVENTIPELGVNEVLCKTICSLVSIGTELTCLRGVFDPGTNWEDFCRYPYMPGSSNVAEVVQTGAAVTMVRPGDRVMYETGHRELYVAQEAELLPLPEWMDAEDAVWLILSLVAQNAVRRVQVQMGDMVAVIGGGQIGQLIVQFLRIAGAAEVVVIDRHPSRLALAKKSGATELLACAAGEAVGKRRGIAKDRMLDIVVDATGNPEVLATACRMVRKHGRVLLVGDTSTPARQVLGPNVVSDHLAILGSHSTMTAAFENPFYPYTVRRIHEINMAYCRQGRLRFDHLNTHTVLPADLPKLYESLLEKKRDEMGILVDWGGMV